MNVLTRLLEEQYAHSQTANRRLKDALANVQKSDPDSLAAYLDGECVQIDERINKLRDCIKGVCGVLLGARESGRNYWPYSCRPDASGELLAPEYMDGKVSISTQAMCCSSVEEIIRANRINRLLSPSDIKKLRDCITATCITIKAVIEGTLKEKSLLWESRTFGDNDVFTASWMIRLIAYREHWSEDVKKQFDWPDDLKKKIIEAIRTAAGAKNKTNEAEKGTENLDLNIDQCLFRRNENEAGAHSLPLLKLVEAIKAIQESPDLSRHWGDVNSTLEILERAGGWFEKNLHRQMSFYEFLDFRFDAAELIFCLSGAILTGVVNKNEAIIEDVLAVIREAQSRSVYWRPYRPMLSTSQGMVLLPLSIEVATALLTTLTIKETNRFGKFKDTLDKYFEWLLNQRIEPSKKPPKWVGWHSENAYETRIIHVWDTALVSRFLVDYWDSIEQEVQAEILRISSFTVKRPEAIKKGIDQLVSFDSSCDEKTTVKICAEFANKNEEGQRDYSLLLYGPPGVSKTTIAEGIAKTRDEPLVYLSPSDFITRGEAGIEQQAKTIFRALKRLRAHVIFFDEIDRMILDRDSLAYGNQSDLFQFMTPGMLTKLNELREAERSLFIIATNYFERIDRAIRRPGRIDRSYLCLPYDWNARTLILKSLVDSGWSDKNIESEPWGKETENRLKEFAKRVALYTFPELKGLFHDLIVVKLAGIAQFRSDMVNQLLKITPEQPQNALESYTRRTIKPDREAKKFPQKPFEEHACLLLLKAETLGPGERAVLTETFKELQSTWKKAPQGDYDTKWKGIEARAKAYNLKDWLT